MKRVAGKFGLTIVALLNVNCSTLKGQPAQGNPPTSGSSEGKVARLAEIVSRVKTIAPNLVDATGASQDRTPGLIVGVLTAEGHEVLGFGTTQIQGGKIPDGDTLFGIGSVTKVFTGLILADAVVRGKMGLDDSANKYLPQDLAIPNDNITLRHLVTHTSGLPDFPANLKDFRDLDNDGVGDSNQYSPGRNYSRKNLADWLAGNPSLEFEPGARGLYSNLGIGMLGWALQTKLGHSSFEAMNRELIALPLGMNSTVSKTESLNGDSLRNQSQGYFPENGSFTPVPFSNMGVLGSAGELVSTANDMVKFLGGLTGISNNPLNSAFAESSRSLASLGADEMGYGFKITKSTKGGVYYSKTGATAGNSAIIVWRNNPKIGFVLICNRGKFNQVNELAARMIEAAVR